MPPALIRGIMIEKENRQLRRLAHTPHNLIPLCLGHSHQIQLIPKARESKNRLNLFIEVLVERRHEVVHELDTPVRAEALLLLLDTLQPGAPLAEAHFERLVLLHVDLHEALLTRYPLYLREEHFLLAVVVCVQALVAGDAVAHKVCVLRHGDVRRLQVHTIEGADDAVVHERHLGGCLGVLVLRVGFCVRGGDEGHWAPFPVELGGR